MILSFRNSLKKIVNMTFSGKSRGLYDLIKKITVARHRFFILNQINKLIMKFFPQLRFLHIS